MNFQPNPYRPVSLGALLVPMYRDSRPGDCRLVLLFALSSGAVQVHQTHGRQRSEPYNKTLADFNTNRASEEDDWVG